MLRLSLLVLLAAPQDDPWAFHLEEQAIQELWMSVSRENRPRDVLFEGAEAVTMGEAGVVHDAAVLVRDGRLAWIGPMDHAPETSDDVLRVDARGKFVMPGLVDMHTHRTATHAQSLLSLANGVTAERDLNGFPWTLAQRERIRSGTLLAPDLHVSGHILNERPMGIFATVVTTPDEARAAVREQVERGYDFIKVHNNMSLDVYRAVHDEARRHGLRVVGHVPQDVTLAEALERGHHTLEHLKGYILDRGLELTTEDYVALTDGSGAWNCPTLSTRVIGLFGDEAFAFLDGFEGLRYVPRAKRESWFLEAEHGDPANSHARVWELSRKIFVDLLATDARFLAGSDSGGGYPNQVPGFMLPEELSLMEGLGLPTLECLRAATSYAAEALETEEIGVLEVGRVASLILLDRNPLETVEHVRRPSGVLVRGVWLPRRTLDRYLGEIEALCDAEVRPTEAEDVDRFLARMLELHEAGFVFMTHRLEELAGLLSDAGRAADAERVLALAVR